MKISLWVTIMCIAVALFTGCPGEQGGGDAQAPPPGGAATPSGGTKRPPGDGGELFESFRDGTLAIASGDYERVEATTTAHFRRSLLAENRRFLEGARAKDDAALRGFVIGQYGMTAGELLALPDGELLKLLLEKAGGKGDGAEYGGYGEKPGEKAPSAAPSLETLRGELDGTTIASAQVRGEKATLIVEDGRKRRQSVSLAREKGRWRLDAIRILPAEEM